MNPTRQDESARPPAVGELVCFELGRHLVRGVVIEDRGPIGVGGRRILRVRIEPDEGTRDEVGREIELPQEEVRGVAAA